MTDLDLRLTPSALPPGAVCYGGGAWCVRELSRPAPNTDITSAVVSPAMHVAFPGICQTARGELLVVYREGFTHAAGDDPSDGRIMLVRSPDLGVTWSSPEVVIETAAHDDRNSAIACMSDGTVVVCWDKYLHGAHHGAFFVTSADEGHTWSAPTRLATIDNVHTRSPALELSADEWLFPVPCSDSTGDDLATYGVIYNRRHGTQEVILITPRGNRSLGDECALARARDGRIVALVRSNWEPVLWQTVSFDEGRTWLAPWATTIPSQFTPADLIALADGNLLCSFSFRERRNERQVLSRDNGETWQVEDSIDVFRGTPPTGDRSYPAAVELAPGIIGTVLYETRPHPGGGRIHFCRTRVADIGARRRPALCQDDPAAESATLALPAHGACLELSYRFTGLFGPPANALRISLLDTALHPRATVTYRLGATPDRSIEPYTWLLVTDAAGTVVHDAEAAGGWFDDGNEHRVTLDWHAGRLTVAWDGHPQYAGPLTRAPAHIAVGTRRAAVAIYDLRFSD